MLKKLRVKFVCINMLIVTLLLVVIFSLVLYFTKENLEAESVSMMHEIALNPVQRTWEVGEDNHVRLPYFALQISKNGEILATSGNAFDMSDAALMEFLLNTARNARKQTGVISDYNLRYYCAVSSNGTNLVFVDISSERSTLQSLVKSCGLIGIISFVAFLFVSILLARWAIQPVEAAWKQQKQFVSDASHELKTPLTVILTNAEMLQDPDCGMESKEKFSDNILTMAEQMQGLVEGLLELARVDNGAVQTAFAQVDLSQLVSESILPFEPLFFEQELTLQSKIQEHIMLKGSERHLRQVVDILLDNARKYASPQGETLVQLQRSGRSQCLLTISNQGEPIPQTELRNIFKRFYRVDPARRMNHSYGLGLSIAEGIVRDHHGKIWAASAGGYNTFYVQLPLHSGTEAGT